MNKSILDEKKEMSRKETQNEKILKYLQNGNSITPTDALNLFGCFRLGARIHNLRKKGYQIETKRKSKDGKSFAVYSLKNTEVACAY